MEEKYKIINRELVLKNQCLKETINLLTTEVSVLKEKQFVTHEQNRKLLKQINEHETFKKQILDYLTKIFELMYPKSYPNSAVETSDVNTRIFSYSFNGVNNNAVENNTRSGVNSSEENSPMSSSVICLTQRRKRKSIPLTRTSNGSEQIVSSPRNIPNTSMESECSQENSQNALEINGNSTQSPRNMKTITEEEEISNHNSILTSSASNFENVSRVARKVTLKNKSTPVIPEMNALRPLDQPSFTDNISISNVPCSTPYQRRNKSVINGSAPLKTPKILLKKLKLHDLQKYGITINSLNNNRNLVHEKTIKKEKFSTDAKSQKFSPEIVVFDEGNLKKSENIDEFDLVKTERNLRSRKKPKCLAEPSLRVKLRRLQ